MQMKKKTYSVYWHYANGWCGGCIVVDAISKLSAILKAIKISKAGLCFRLDEVCIYEEE
jgi:hypothetical protein